MLKYSRSIAPDENIITKSLELITKAFNKVPLVFKEKGYDLIELIKEQSDEADDALLTTVINVARDKLLDDPERENLPVDLDIFYQENIDDIEARYRDALKALELVFGRKGAAKLISAWYIKKNTTSIINELKTLIGHELVHKEQGGVIQSILKQKNNPSEIGSNYSQEYKDAIKKSAIPIYKEMHSQINEQFKKDWEEKGRYKILKEYDRSSKSILNNSPQWRSYVPSYLKGYYKKIKETLPEDLHQGAIALIVKKLYTEIFKRYYEINEDRDWISYLSHPNEIMAYAYSLVSKAKAENYSKEQLIEAINNPEQHKKVLYPLDFYDLFRDLKESKSLPINKKQEIWKKFLKHIHGYIEQVYPKDKKDS